MRTCRGFILYFLSFLFLSFPLKAQPTELMVGNGILILLRGDQLFANVIVEVSGEIQIDVTVPPDDQSGRLSIIGNRIEVQNGGRINGSHSFGVHDWPLASTNTGGVGGGYGGNGGAPDSVLRNLARGTKNGVEIERGTRGGDGPSSVRIGGQPGGVLILRGETLVIDGTINVDGKKGQDWSSNPLYGPAPQRYFGAGGGSGGGILIIARNLTIGPNAKITANGGDGGDGKSIGAGYEGYPGGGGRIKIFYENGTIDETAVIEAIAGTPPEGGYKGGVEDGTIHIEQVKSIDHLLNPSDANGDGVTDYKDLFLIHENWQKEITPIPTAVCQ